MSTSASRVLLSASVSCIDPLWYRRDFAQLDRAGIDGFHFDVCDGHFAPTLQLSAAVVRSARRLSRRRLDVHLYCTHPSRYIDEFADAGADCLIIPVETTEDYREVVRLVVRRGLAAGIGILPGTVVPGSLAEVIDLVSVVVANTVGPAYSGQPFDSRGLDSVRAVRDLAHRLRPDLEIAVDGSVSAQRVAEMLEAGGRHLICGTASVFAPGRKPAANLRSFRREVQAAFARQQVRP